MKQVIYETKKQHYSMEYKLGMALLNWIGIPTYFLGIVANWGDIKGLILFLLSLIFFFVRLVFYIDERIDARRSRRIENDMKEVDLKKKIDDYNEQSEEKNIK